MRTAALIENGVVSNVIVIADGPEGDKTLIDLNAIETTGTDTRITDLYDGASFIRVKTQEEIEAEQRYEEYLQKKQALLEKLGLTEEEAKLLGL